MAEADMYWNAQRVISFRAEEKTNVTLRLVNLHARQHSQLVALHGEELVWSQKVSPKVKFASILGDEKGIWWMVDVKTDSGTQKKEVQISLRTAEETAQCLEALRSTQHAEADHGKGIELKTDSQILESLARVDSWKWTGCKTNVHLHLENKKNVALQMTHFPGRRYSQLAAYHGSSEEEMWKVKLTPDIKFNLVKSVTKRVLWSVVTQNDSVPEKTTYNVNFDSVQTAESFMAAIAECQSDEDVDLDDEECEDEEDGDADVSASSDQSVQPTTEQLQKIVTRDLRCSVCMEMMKGPTVLGCGHSFCEGCIDRNKENKKENTCPVCRTTITVSLRNLSLDSIIAGIAQSVKQSK